MVFRHLIFIYFLVSSFFVFAHEHPGEAQYDDFMRHLNYPRVSRENWFIWYNFNEANPGYYQSPLAFFLANDMADYSFNEQRWSEMGVPVRYVCLRVDGRLIRVPKLIPEESADDTVSEGESHSEGDCAGENEGEDPFEIDYEPLADTRSETDSDAHSGSTEIG